MKIPIGCSLLVLVLSHACAASLASSLFDKPELQVTRSPNQARQIALPEGVRLLDYDVSPTGPLTALLVVNPAGIREVLFWDANQDQPTTAWQVPAELRARSLTWHPEGKAFFVVGAQGQQYVIFRVETNGAGGGWSSRQIYASQQEIRRLVVGPRPFLVPGTNGIQNVQAYRLFFGLRSAKGGYSTRSIVEDGRREYQVVGPAETIVKVPDAGVDPSLLTAASALPVGFHPAGHLLLWEDGKGCFQSANYYRDHWDKTAKLFKRELCGGTVSTTPNGAGIIHWVNGTEGVELLFHQGSVTQRAAAGFQLVSAPSSVPDGRGIVGVTRTATGFAVNYIPIQVPLADVTNAWMYLEAPTDTDLLAKHGGLFRELKTSDQLYTLYDSESYYCHGYDESTPTRPYLVTTDSFWELFAAAYEGIFIVRERQSAIPAFWDFVEKANGAMRNAPPKSRWRAVFAALHALNTKPTSNAEAQRISQADGRHPSSVTGADFDYTELKPRGHYASTPSSQKYFQAFRYLTRISALNWPTDDLKQLPPEVKSAALRWTGAYQDMISPSRAPLVWQGQQTPTPSYIRRPLSASNLFPLSWGFDNETLLSTVYHRDWPEAERIEGSSGGRLMPSAVDIAAAFGSRFAADILADQISKYPRLKSVLAELSQRNRGNGDEQRPNLYDQWIEALGQQWADSVPSPGGQLDETLWRAKRLQTGLASWATLRHATVLVSARIGAECGEAGFEAIVMRPPRGYVEPDPETFSRLAELFDAAGRAVATVDGLTGLLPPQSEWGIENREALKQGLLRRLSETAAKARAFQSMAAKEVRGEALTASEYEEILRFGRVAEHHFLIYKSVANKDLALSNPNPIPKIVDVADTEGHAPYWMVAVGRPLEWDHTVPYFGRREIVKGAAYSFYEFESNTLMNDTEWTRKLAAQPRPSWIAPYVSPNALSCPARNPF